jgi:uncharacterized Fe-S cluster-containing protein
MRKPCKDDLLEAAGALRMIPDDAGTYSRVAQWLETTALEIDDRARARQLGCSVKYLRNVIDKEARERIDR